MVHLSENNHCCSAEADTVNNSGSNKSPNINNGSAVNVSRSAEL